MARRYYSSTAVATTLSGNINNSATSITVAALTGYPAQTPWTAVLEPDTVNEEVVEVTNVSGTTLTVTRGVDGTTAVSHSSGSRFQHGVSGRDFDEANAFVNGGGIPSTALTSTAPANLASTASAGSSSDVARRDHVHAFPSASDVGAVANSLVNAKGDLVTATANDTPAVLTVGANDTVLTADSSTATGLAWKAASGGISNTLLDAKGDLIAASSNDTAARLAAGSNGQMLMADSSATAGLRYVDPPANRNMVVNGAMQVHQRGTSSTGITTFGYFTADRWFMTMSSLGTWTQTLETDAPTGSGLRKSLKVICTTADAAPAAGDFCLIEHKLEGQDLQRIRKGTSDAQQLSLSFWVKANVTGTYVVELKDEDNTRTVSASYTVSASATWERKTITFPADTTGAFDNDNANSLTLEWWLGAGTNFTSGTLNTTWNSNTNANRAVGQTNLAAATNNYWQITGVQLETGPVATPFEFEPYEATLRKCQRYYYRITPGDQNLFDTGWNSTTNNHQAFVHFPVPLRVAPTALEQTGTAANYRIAHAATVSNCTTAPAFISASILGSQVQSAAAGALTAGQGAALRSNDAAAYLAWSAEL